MLTISVSPSYHLKMRYLLSREYFLKIHYKVESALKYNIKLIKYHVEERKTHSIMNLYTVFINLNYQIIDFLSL